MTNKKTELVSRSSGVGLGTELNQTYRIDSLIGVGGMGEVFRGHNIQTGDPVAIKIVLPEFAKDEMILELFRKEARILNHLAHDAIVRYYVFSIDHAIGRPYLAMEFVDGPSLAERLRAEPVSPDDVALLQWRLADGLQKAHDAGVIHRDMSPDNVILPGGLVSTAKIIDFGIARSANVGGATLLGGSFAGKYNFVSPEQLGLFGANVTPKSDVYSLALVLIAALRGRPLDMSGSQVEVIEKRRVVPDLSDVSPKFRGLLEAMLQPDPADRLPTMAAVRDWKPPGAANFAVSEATIIQPRHKKPEPAVSKAKIPPPPSLTPQKPVRPTGLRNLAIGVAVLSVMGAGVFGGWYYVKSHQPEQKPAVAQANVTPQESDQTPPPQQTAPAPMPDQQAQPGETPQPAPTPDQQTQPAEPPLPVTPPKISQDTALAPLPTPPVQAPAPPLQPIEPQAVTPAPLPAEPNVSGAAGQPDSTPVTAGSKPTVEPPAPPPQPEVQKKVEAALATKPQPQPLAPANPPIQKPASLPPALPKVAMVSQASVRDMTAFVTGYAGGACFSATPLSITETAASLSGYGKETEAFRKFKAAYKVKAGFEPNMQVHIVSEQQCDLVNVIGKLSAPNVDAPLLQLNKQELKLSSNNQGQGGDILEGIISNFGRQQVDVLLVDNEGGVQNIRRICADCVRQSGNSLIVRITLNPTAEASQTVNDTEKFRPIMIMAIASPHSLRSIEGQDVFQASDLMPELAKEISQSNEIATAIGYVKLMN